MCFPGKRSNLLRNSLTPASRRYLHSEVKLKPPWTALGQVAQYEHSLFSSCAWCLSFDSRIPKREWPVSFIKYAVLLGKWAICIYMFEYFAFVFTRSSGKKKERKVSIIVFCLGMMTKHHKSPNVGVSDMRINLQQLLQYFSYDYNKPIFVCRVRS